MKYLTYGDKKNKTVLLIHGMATTARQCYEAILPYLQNYYVVLVEVDGHIPGETEPLRSIPDACTDIERYIEEELNSEVYCLGGFSMGATMAVEIAARQHIKIDKLFIDAAFLVRMGPLLTPVYTFMFCFFIHWIQEGKTVPGILLDSIMGKGNRAIIEMLYEDVRKETIKAACQYVYAYTIPASIKGYTGDVLFIYGSHEPYPRQSARLLASYLPSMKQKEIKDMGHGQFLHSQPDTYGKLLCDHLSQQ